MNKYQKAFENIHDDLERMALSDKPDTTPEDYKNIKHLVNKETPVKPNCINDNKLCSKCGFKVTIIGERNMNYCSNCGQRQDWGDQYE